MMKPKVILNLKNSLGEGPLWHPEEQKLYWVDIMAECFYRYNPADGVVERFETGVQIGALAFRRGGGLVMATRQGFAFWDEQTQQLDFIADPEADRPDSRFNDGKVDPQGRFWAGTMGDTDRGNSFLYRLDADQTVHQMEANVSVSNGLAWSADQRTMYYTDSPVKEIYAYDYEPLSGAINNRRIFSHTPEQSGFPDGLCLDAEGHIWSARWDGWKVYRYAPTGEVVAEIDMPVQRPTSCCFGGPNLNELYITSASVDLTKAELKEQPLAGALFKVKVGVTGFAATFYKG